MLRRGPGLMWRLQREQRAFGTDVRLLLALPPSVRPAWFNLPLLQPFSDHKVGVAGRL